MSNSGIYLLKNTITNQVYIGQSIDLERRKREHFHELKTNNHVNNYLQNSFNHYGEDAFEFKILCKCSKEDLDEEEIKFINLYDSKQQGFNICDGGVNVCPDNSNSNHGMWRKDISNEKIKEMYLQNYNSTQIAEFFNCSRRTINRRLIKIFGKEKYDQLKYEKQVSKIKETVQEDPNIKTEDILFYAKQGYNSVQIASIIGCSDSTVMSRLHKNLSQKEYENYKKKNTEIKMSRLREKAFTPENIKKKVTSLKKYTLWDGSNVHYNKVKFYARYNAKDLPIGSFNEFISPQIIINLIKEMINNE